MATMTFPGEITYPLQPMSVAVREAMERLSIDDDLAGLRQDDDIGDEDFIYYMRNIMTPVRLSITSPGNQRVVKGRNKGEVADTLEASQEVVTCATKLYNFKSDKWQRVNKIVARARKLWQRMSVDYPYEDGVRLMRRERIEFFIRDIHELQAELREAVLELNERYDEILEEGRVLRGKAFDRADYPDHLLNSYSIAYSFPSVECAAEIKKLNPQLWINECQRVRESLNDALHKAEAEYLEGLDEAISHLIERLRPGEEGEKKTFRDTALTNIVELVDSFQKMNIGGRESVMNLTRELESATGNTTPELLRKYNTSREIIRAKMEAFQLEVQRLKLEEEADHARRKNVRQLRRSKGAAA